MSQFDLYRTEIVRERLSAAMLYMAIPLYLSFSALDYLFSPKIWFHFFLIRAASVSCFALLGAVVARSKQLSHSRMMLICHTVTCILGTGIGYMTHATGGLASPYYAGLNWIAIGSLAFWPTPWAHRLITIATIYLPLAILELFLSKEAMSSAGVLSFAFMVGTVVLSLLSNSLSLMSLRREYDLRSQLETLIKNKDKIIEMKSAESANLKRLAKQFSPNVIEAIETKSIALDQRQRRNVTVIFVDVVSSTNRANHLDHVDYQKALDTFFDIAIKRLLEKNITVANFMGDGLMAVVNAPNSVTQHERIAFDACSDIVQETNKRQRQLKALWQDDFRIRVGIASGFATVGFFPNSDFGIYTALGDSVNLASRLCSVAESGTIAITKPVALAAQDLVSRCELKRGGSIGSLKGFSGHQVEYFVAQPQSGLAPSKVTSGGCPLCGDTLAVSADMGATVLLKCSSCQYSDIETKADPKAAA